MRDEASKGIIDVVLKLLVIMTFLMQPHICGDSSRKIPNKCLCFRPFFRIHPIIICSTCGWATQHVYGYNKPLHQGSSESEEIATDRGNAASLAKALYTAVGLPMAFCCLIYSFLYSTYPRDRERARMEALMESEMQEILTNQLPEGGEYSQSQFPKTEESYIRDRSVIEVEYENDDDHDTDENDENAFLYRQLTFSNLGE